MRMLTFVSMLGRMVQSQVTDTGDGAVHVELTVGDATVVLEMTHHQLAAFHQQLTRHLERREVKKATASVGAPAVAVNR